LFIESNFIIWLHNTSNALDANCSGKMPPQEYVKLYHKKSSLSFKMCCPFVIFS
jgi:hypothetical protein